MSENTADRPSQVMSAMWKRQMLRLRMERQHLTNPADEEEYLALYRDTQPGQNVYWHGFGEPPVMSFRTDFDDKEYNRIRRQNRQIVKGRFQGGNLGWIVSEDMELFACMCRKPLTDPSPEQLLILRIIDQEGPMNIQQLKEETGLLVKEITPALHRLQEAFILYEDQFDGEWDRGWYRFEEMFPEVDPERYTGKEALKIVLKRFAFRMVWFHTDMAKSFYRLPAKDIKAAVKELCKEGHLTEYAGGYLGCEDQALLTEREMQAAAEEAGREAAESLQKDVQFHRILIMHRNDILIKAFEHEWKAKYREYKIESRERWPEASDFEILYLILTDGEIHGAVLGKFKYGPYIIEDIVVDEEYVCRREEILEAVKASDPESPIFRFMGEPI